MINICALCGQSFKAKRGTKKFCSRYCFGRNVSRLQLGSSNSNWHENVGYKALHDWVKRHLAKPIRCESCRRDKPLDLANISQEYKRDLADWEWLCRLCHQKKDGRWVKFQRTRKSFERGNKVQAKTMITYKGLSLGIKEWAKYIGIGYSTFYRRTKEGLNLEEIYNLYYHDRNHTQSA